VKFKVNMETFEVEQVQDFRSLPGIQNNGQHDQLPGHVLVEVRFSGITEILLYHPETLPSTGHIDITYRPRRIDGEYGVDINIYAHQMSLDFGDSSKHHWPSGGWHLLRVIDAIEQTLFKLVDYSPQLNSYIEHTFQQTPRRQMVAAV